MAFALRVSSHATVARCGARTPLSAIASAPLVTPIVRTSFFPTPVRMYGGGGHGYGANHGSPVSNKKFDEWDHPGDALYWHSVAPSHKHLCKELSEEEHHASTYMAPHHVAAPGVYDELSALDRALSPTKAPQKAQPAAPHAAHGVKDRGSHH